MEISSRLMGGGGTGIFSIETNDRKVEKDKLEMDEKHKKAKRLAEARENALKILIIYYKTPVYTLWVIGKL